MDRNYYTKSEIKKEQEANAFACYLLMPEYLFLPRLIELRKKSNDEDKTIKELSEIFQVPEHAVVNRINLIDKSKLFPQP